MPRSHFSGLAGLILTLVVGSSAIAAADAFKLKPANKYPARQKQGDVTVAVKPFHTDKETKGAFGKAKPMRHGFLPVLVVINNNSDDALGLEDLKVRFITSDRDGIEPTSAEDLAYYQPNTRPKERPRYIPSIPGMNRPKVKKGPLARPEIAGRAFRAPVVPPRSSVGGFFYYQTGTESNPIPGAAIYISGIRNLNTGRDLFYFEISLDKYR